MAPPEGEGGGGGRREGGFGQSISGIIRMAVLWYFASKFFSPKRPSTTDPPILRSNLFHKSEPLDLWVYLSETEKFSDFGSETALVWHETNIPYAVWGPQSTRSLSLKCHPSQAVKQNGSVYAHVFFSRSGYPADPNDPEYLPLASFSRSHALVTYLPKSKADTKISLLGDGDSAQTHTQASSSFSC